MKEHNTILAALAAALPELESAKKNKPNPAFKSKYADFGAIIEAIEPIREHGLWFRQFSHDRDGGSAVETFYIHATGELSAGVYFVPAEKSNAHGYGSANSYARRYGLQTAFGLATEDDDGNAASAAPAKQNLQKITASQVEELRAVIDASKYDVREVCERKKVNSLNDLSAEDFRHLMTALGKKG